MNCDSCGAILPVGVAHCPWCNTPTVRPRLFAPTPFLSPAFQSRPSQSPQPQQVPQAQQPLQSIPHTQPQSSRYNVNKVDIRNDEQEPAKQRRIGSIIFFSVFVLVVIALLLTGAYFVRKEMATIHTTVAIVKHQLNNPTGHSINATAAAILSHAQIASKIDNTLAPVQLASSFTTGQHVYVTFHIDSKGQDGTIQVRWYADGKQLSISMFHHTHENMQGLVSYVYAIPAKVGVVALFWCLRQDCSDAQLATVLRFTVLVGTGPVVHVHPDDRALSNESNAPYYLNSTSLTRRGSTACNAASSSDVGAGVSGTFSVSTEKPV